MRPDEAKVTDAGVTFISVLHEGCRLQLLFDGPVQPGSLPRIDDTCLVRDRATFLTTDGGSTSVALAPGAASSLLRSLTLARSRARCESAWNRPGRRAPS